jgi:BCD family chlorophyll transporter-like MFS transporter
MFGKQIQLGLIHLAVAITLVPINGTLNRIMIHDLSLSAALVGALVSLPYLFSPIQVAIGSFSDRNPILGWRRTPYIFFGLLLCVVSLIFSPQVAIMLSENFATGVALGIVVFGAWGMGFNFATVSYFSLATELSGENRRSRTISVMFFMMIVGIIITSITLSRSLADYSTATLISSFRGVALAALFLGTIGLFGLEPRSQKSAPAVEQKHSWKDIFNTITSNKQATLFFWYLILMLVAILGQDILLEPYAAQAFGLNVEETTRITGIWGGFFMLTLLLGGALESRFSKLKQAGLGAWAGIVSFLLIVISGAIGNQSLFWFGVTLLGLATGLATVSNLSLMLDMTTVGSVGLFIGAWGMANAVARLVGNILGGVVRDAITQTALNPVTGYIVVFLIEALLLYTSLLLLRRVDVSLFQKHVDEKLDIVERAALANEA